MQLIFGFIENGKPRLFPATCDRVRDALLSFKVVDPDDNKPKARDRFVLTRSHTEDGRRAKFLFSAHRVSMTRNVDTTQHKTPQISSLDKIQNVDPEIKTKRSRDLSKSSPEIMDSQNLTQSDPIRPFLNQLSPPSEDDNTKRVPKKFLEDPKPDVQDEVENDTVNEDTTTSPEKEESVNQEDSSATEVNIEESKKDTNEDDKVALKQDSETPTPIENEKVVQEEKLTLLKAKLRQLEADIQDQKKRRQSGE